MNSLRREGQQVKGDEMQSAKPNGRQSVGIWKLEIGIFLFALAVNTTAAWFIQRPGYMDAYYYFGGAKRLAQGYGFTELVLWNYLDNPAGLPHPSHLYWMPLTSLAAGVAMIACGRACPDNASLFRAAQAPSIVFASLLPAIAYLIAVNGRRKTEERILADDTSSFISAERPIGVHPSSLSAAFFTIFSGFYFMFWPNTDAFAIYGVVGSLSLLCASLGLAKQSPGWFGLAGVLAGLGHLARADGVLLLLVALYAGSKNKKGALRFLPPPSFFLVCLGYLLITLPWFLRNLAATGSLFAPGGTQALWFRTYNDLFNYPANLNATAYLAQGWGAIVASKWEALIANLQT
ncbi:MAG: glycosyltransferase family 39 protein, partial [Chloroflexi bacterium]|nr:glycosyltransferase family 39 protein [Chloroflexota bacterium]